MALNCHTCKNKPEVNASSDTDALYCSEFKVMPQLDACGSHTPVAVHASPIRIVPKNEPTGEYLGLSRFSNDETQPPARA
jgi:hypothetical protein